MLMNGNLRTRVGLSALAVLLAISNVPSSATDTPSATSACSGLASPKQFVTHHELVLGGVKISFTATAGETYLYTDAGEPIGSIFSYAYVKDSPPGIHRPVLFITGGGPGGASDTINVGFAGPWTIPVGRLALNGTQQPKVTPPFDVADNPNSLLDVADLVFIDPIGTGYSRAIGKGKPEDFWGVDEDLDSYAQFIQLWLNKNGRWNSPKFFMGESYGGTRAALLPDILMGGPTYPGYLRGITLNGVIALSNGLGLAVGSDGIGQNWTAAVDFPNHALAAWYHNKIDRRGRSLEAFYEEATQFAFSQYIDALRKEADKALTAQERAVVVAKISEFTGLPASTFDKKIELSHEEFATTLLADRGLDISVYDSRYTYPHGRGGGDAVADDAALGRTLPVLTGAFLDLQHDKLKVEMDRPYAAIKWRDLLTNWNFKRRETWTGGYPAVGSIRGTNADELAAAMNRNDDLYVMVATGYYDLIMSPAQARYATERAGIPKNRLILEPFEAGHEPYVDKAGVRLLNDIREMIRKASQ